MKKQKIMGLDTSTNNTGVGIICIDDDRLDVKCSSINLRHEGAFTEEKFRKMVLAINQVIEQEKPNAIVIEDNCIENSPAESNKFQSRKLKNLVGACMAMGYIRDIEVVLYPPTKWRSLTRDKSKDWNVHREKCKEWSIDRVKELFDITTRNDDEADAVLIAYAYIKEHKEDNVLCCTKVQN